VQGIVALKDLPYDILNAADLRSYSFEQIYRGIQACDSVSSIYQVRLVPDKRQEDSIWNDLNAGRAVTAPMHKINICA